MRDWARFCNLFYKQLERWHIYCKNHLILNLPADSKMSALAFKEPCVTSSPQCYFKAVSAKSAEMPVHHFLPTEVHLRFVTHLEEINILKLGILIKVIKVMFSELKRLLEDFCLVQDTASTVSRTTTDKYTRLIRHNRETSQKKSTVRNQCIRKVCNYQEVWTLSVFIYKAFKFWSRVQWLFYSSQTFRHK